MSTGLSEINDSIEVKWPVPAQRLVVPGKLYPAKGALENSTKDKEVPHEPFLFQISTHTCIYLYRSIYT